MVVLLCIRHDCGFPLHTKILSIEYATGSDVSIEPRTNSFDLRNKKQAIGHLSLNPYSTYHSVYDNDPHLLLRTLLFVVGWTAYRVQRIDTSELVTLP